MKLRRAYAVAALLPLFLLLPGNLSSAAPEPRDEGPRLLAELNRESNPVKKAKLEVRLARVRLAEAIDAYANGRYDDFWKLLGVYEEFMKKAWADLQASGRIAARKPDGFKQLDIGLRESRRDLENFETRVTFDERQEVQKIRARTDEIHNQVLKALFPSAPSNKNKSGSPGETPGDPNP